MLLPPWNTRESGLADTTLSNGQVRGITCSPFPPYSGLTFHLDRLRPMWGGLCVRPQPSSTPKQRRNPRHTRCPYRQISTPAGMGHDNVSQGLPCHSGARRVLSVPPPALLPVFDIFALPSPIAPGPRGSSGFRGPYPTWKMPAATKPHDMMSLHAPHGRRVVSTLRTRIYASEHPALILVAHGQDGKPSS